MYKWLIAYAGVCVRLSGLVWFTIFKSQLSQFDFLFMRNYSALYGTIYGTIRGVYKLSANRVQQCTLTLAGATLAGCQKPKLT